MTWQSGVSRSFNFLNINAILPCIVFSTYFDGGHATHVSRSKLCPLLNSNNPDGLSGGNSDKNHRSYREKRVGVVWWGPESFVNPLPTAAFKRKAALWSRRPLQRGSRAGKLPRDRVTRTGVSHLTCPCSRPASSMQRYRELRTPLMATVRTATARISSKPAGIEREKPR